MSATAQLPISERISKICPTVIQNKIKKSSFIQIFSFYILVEIKEYSVTTELDIINFFNLKKRTIIQVCSVKNLYLATEWKQRFNFIFHRNYNKVPHFLEMEKESERKPILWNNYLIESSFNEGNSKKTFPWIVTDS